MTSRNSRTIVELISDGDRQIYDIVNFVVICSAISLFGVVANLMNMVVFYKQGLNSNMNISFFGLALSDLCSLITLLWWGIFLNPLLVRDNIPMVNQEVHYLTDGIPRVYFGKIATWITVYITAERCLCIMMPLKIKLVITPRRTVIILCLICTIMMLVFLPEYMTSYLDWKFYPEKNRTLLGISFTKNRVSVEGLTYIVYSVLGSVSFVVLVVVTIVLVTQLKQKTKWRRTASRDIKKNEIISKRERKTVIMVVMTAAVLIVCYTPGAAVSMITFFKPHVSVDGVNVNAYFVLWSFVYVCDGINSSINIFLYYKMSSKYRETFNQVFGFRCGRRKFDCLIYKQHRSNSTL